MVLSAEQKTSPLITEIYGVFFISAKLIRTFVQRIEYFKFLSFRRGISAILISINLAVLLFAEGLWLSHLKKTKSRRFQVFRSFVAVNYSRSFHVLLSFSSARFNFSYRIFYSYDVWCCVRWNFKISFKNMALTRCLKICTSFLQ